MVRRAVLMRLGVSAIALCQFHPRLEPELRFAGGMLDMNVSPWFFAREEVEPVPADAKNRWTHNSGIYDIIEWVSRGLDIVTSLERGRPSAHRGLPGCSCR